MSVKTELRAEQKALVRADRDIGDGEERIARQQKAVAGLMLRGSQSDEAERFLRLLGQTLETWKIHRELILHRIACLEERLDSR